MKFKQTILTILICIICFTPSFSMASDASNLQIYSNGCVLIEYNSGKILAEKQAFTKMYPASTTKVITAIITLENSNLTDLVTASYEAVMTIPNGYNNVVIEVGETLTVEQLLNLLLLPSGNVAGNILAEHVAGSIDSFVTMMNTKAIELGCENTHFANPYGKQDENHYSTPYDLALIARYAMGNDIFRQIVQKTSFTLEPTNKCDVSRTYKNTNDMLQLNSKYYDERVIGIKTGYTNGAKNCLIACGYDSKSGLELISVVLGGGTTESGLSERYLDTKTLLDFGFDNFKFEKIAHKNSTITEVKVDKASKETKNLELILEDDVNILMESNKKYSELSPKIELIDKIEVPIKAGDVLGTVSYEVDGLTYTAHLLAKNDVHPIALLDIIFKVLVVLIILFIILEFTTISKNKRNKKYRNKHMKK